MANWPVEKRISTARKRIRVLTDAVLEVIDLHAANEIIQYSDKLSKQVPRSYAASAFRTFQDAQFKFEIIRLLALWDKASTNTNSIPSAIVLIDDPEVLSELARQVYDVHARRGVHQMNRDADPKVQDFIDKQLRSSQSKFAKEQSKQALETLKSSVRDAKEIVKRERSEAVRNLRDHLAHSLTETRRETKGPVKPMKYGDETKLLNESIKLIENLYCWVNGTSFDICEDCFEQSRAAARELWGSCKFNIE